MKRFFAITLMLLTMVIMAVAQELVPETMAERTYRDSLMIRARTLAKADSIAAADRKALLEGTTETTAAGTDSTKVKQPKAKRDWTTWSPDPKKAVRYALIPGGGQIYNRKYWKLPIIYGGLLGCIYAWRWNGQMYDSYKQAYDDITDDDPTTKSYESFKHIKIDPNNLGQYTNLFKSRKDQYRRWRDLSIIVMGAVYALSIIDAYVDASLSKFDISEDLSLHVQPAYIDGRNKHMTASRNIFESGGMGVHCTLDF